MRLSVLTASVLLLCTVAAWSADAKVADAKVDDVNGTWVPESIEMAGTSLPEEARKGIKLVIKDDKYTVTVRDRVDEGTSKTDASAKPKTLDLTGTNGPNKGRTLLAIYELDGDTMKVCYDMTGKNRPKEFKSPPGSQTLLATYKREKPKAD